MIGIHQSQFLSWTPFYYKVLKSDSFVVMDNVQFQKNGVQNRNMIKTPLGESWITIPVKHSLDTPINEVFVSNKDIYNKLLKTFDANYKKSVFFDRVFTSLQEIFDKSFDRLHDLNNALFLKMLETLQAPALISYTSELNTTLKKDDLVIEIIKSIGDNEYLSGSGALGYMDLKKFKNAGIKIYTYKFDCAPYEQLWNNRVGFIKNLSIVDLLFNECDQAREYIHKNGNIERII
jgi:WbqC-like protein family